MTPEVVVTEDPGDAAAERISHAVRPGAQIVLTGGSTPRGAYERLAGMDLDWADVGVWFSDERCVPPEHEHSNYRMTRVALLDRARNADSVHRIRGELGPEEGAAAYEDELRANVGAAPRFDLVLLGIGSDAHTCSLFPNDAALAERERLAAGVETPGMAPLVSRVTLTLPVVNAARDVVFLVSGEDKAEAVARGFSRTPDPGAPASLVRPSSGSLTLLLDPPAARLLEAVR